MSDSANSGAGEGQEAVVDLKKVCERELGEISLRREREFDRREDDAVIRKSLIGLALSGGGVRSAAFSLGVLQGLHRYGVLPFIDYLSTVSGGGYAGAYLSSSALRSQATDADEPESDFKFPVADLDGKQSPRMLKFIHGGSYLRKTGVFINRYLTGLFLIWLVVLSGLMAMASLVTYVFRMLDIPTCMDWTTALGFKGDVLRALFPSAVLFGLWALMWAISYFKFGRHATGNIARFFFYMLVASLLVALAALLGTGDISFSGGSSHTSFSMTFRTLIFGGIAASLLPYLTPQRLIQSGTNPRNVGEKYVFWLTTRALAYGVPFLFVAYFARENISHYNDYRDDRLVRSDIRKWEPAAPMWTPFVGNEDVESGNIWFSALRSLRSYDANDKWEQLTRGDRNFRELDQLRNDVENSASRIPEHLASLALPRLESLRSELREILKQESKREFLDLGVETNSENSRIEVLNVLLAMVDFQIQSGWEVRLAASQIDKDELDANSDGLLDNDDPFKRPKQYTEISLWNRWWHFLAYAGEQVVGDNKEAAENVFAKIIEARRESREAKAEIVTLMNREIRKPDFYKTFLPSQIFGEPAVAETASDNKDIASASVAAAFERVSELHPKGSTDKKGSRAEEWLGKLRELRVQAESLERTITSPGTTEIPTDNISLQTAVAKDDMDRAVYSINRQLLRAYYGTAIEDRSTVYASVVLEEDQQARWEWFFYSSIVFLIACALVDLNATSWHGFYSTRLASMWIEKTPGLAKGLPLAQLETTSVGRPYHLLTGAVHIRRLHDGAEFTTKRDRFLFSKLYCGSPSTNYIETGQYLDGEYTLEDAVAISGAAVSPVQTDNPLIVALLFLANIRLGQWVPNPGHKRWLPQSLHRLCLSIPFTPWRLLCNKLRSIETRSFCFVTDGGHYENLGIGALLERRCHLIIASDAGQDRDFVFADLTRLIRKAKTENGISLVPMGREELPLALQKLVPDSETRLSRGHFLVVKIRYPDAPDGYLVYLKPTLTGDEPFELRQFHRTQEKFPHDPTSDQFYDADRFDSYRALGLHIASELCQSMTERDKERLAVMDSRRFIEQFIGNFDVGASEDEATASSDDEKSAEQLRRLLAELRSSDAAKHDMARQMLERLGAAAFVAMPDLLRAMLDEHWYVKLSVQRLLYDYPRAALPHLVQVIEKSDEVDLQIAAAEEICEYGSGPYVLDDLSSAIGPLVRLSAAKQVAARAAAARALAVIGKDNAEAQEALERCKSDRSQKVRDACQV